MKFCHETWDTTNPIFGLQGHIKEGCRCFLHVLIQLRTNNIESIFMINWLPPISLKSENIWKNTFFSQQMRHLLTICKNYAVKSHIDPILIAIYMLRDCISGIITDRKVWRFSRWLYNKSWLHKSQLYVAQPMRNLLMKILPSANMIGILMFKPIRPRVFCFSYTEWLSFVYELKEDLELVDDFELVVELEILDGLEIVDGLELVDGLWLVDWFDV